MKAKRTLNGYNKIAIIYDWLANVVFGKSLRDSQRWYLSKIRSEDHVLVIGGGSGAILPDIFRAQPNVSVCYVDASSEMIRLAKEKISSAEQVTFIHGTTEDIPSTSFDVIITNFFLDQFTEEELVPLINSPLKSLRSGGIWIATDFVETGRKSHQLLLKLMYVFFGFCTGISANKLPRWRCHLFEAGLVLHEAKHFSKGFVTSAVYFK